jgi:hypothetical protein
LAQQTDQSDVFLREVDEDYRRDRLLQLWNRYGRAALIGLSLGLIGLAGYLFWQDRQQAAAITQADEFTKASAALAGGNMAEAQPILDKLAKSGNAGYRTLARFELAGAQLEQGKKAEAKAAYAAMAADTSVPQMFRDYASVRVILLDYDQLTPAQAIERLKPFAQDGQPWFGTTGELLAIAYYNDGKPELAKPILDAIAGGTQIPESIKTRARMLSDMIGDAGTPAAVAAATPAAKASEPTKAAPAPTPAQAPAASAPAVPPAEAPKATAPLPKPEMSNMPTPAPDYATEKDKP